MKVVSTRSIAVLALVAAMGISIPSVAFASSTGTTTPADSTAPGAGFVTAQKALEVQLANRATELTHLSADVSAATALNASAKAALQARLLTEQASINALIAKVPGDTTWAQLRSDQAAMLKDNRVYAVMTPQVFEMIEASTVATQVATMQGNEAMLQTETNSLLGQAGYHTALNHYNNYVTRLTNWSTRIATVERVVLVQSSQGYPDNTTVFVTQNHQILDANLALAYASYDASIIGLAAGGYSGS
ncbi:MAG: hypothetical protein HKL85_06220 [Acidimicrobiaceae bacterium]|nr:hypothetical protein [Acidimicrobiaceae bacterium]